MKFLAEYRDAGRSRALAKEIAQSARHEWSLMEICGGQTHAILRYGLDQLLPSAIRLIHGPGCPVCVTPLEIIDRAQQLAVLPGVIFCSFGDMLRVPGSRGDLFQAKSQGGDVRIVYSPLDALEIARRNPQRQIVFFAVGFETTAPANAMAVKMAQREKLDNFSMLVSHVLVPPALTSLLDSRDTRIQAVLAAGHVCSVMGYWQYEPIAARHRVPIIITGFEPVDLLDGIRRAVAQLEAGRAEVENAYPRVVTRQGSELAQAILAEVFELTDRDWRGLGKIPASGWRLAEAYREYDAEQRFSVLPAEPNEAPCLCRSGEVLRGVIKPPECVAFGRECTPRHPLGATMVSSEGACAAYFQYGRAE